jgi:hypothetical protein
VTDTDSGDEGGRGTQARARVGDAGAWIGDRIGLLGAWMLVGMIGIPLRALHAGVKNASEVFEVIVPFKSRLYRSLARWAVERMHKSAGGDAVAARLGEDMSLSLEPAKLKDADVDEDGVEQPGWHVKSDDRVWDETMGGRDIARLGKAPVVFLPDDSTRRVSPIEAQVKNAFSRGDWQHLFRVEQPDAVEMDTTLYVDPRAAGGDGAIADGGQNVTDHDTVPTAVKHGVLEDTLVDISQPGRISMARLSEMYREAGDADRMDEVGRLNYEAGRLDAEDTDVVGKVFKLLLAAAALVAAATIGPDLVGGAAAGGAGGGSLVPFVLGLI